MKKNWKNDPHFKHIIYNMTSLTILQSSYTIFEVLDISDYIKLPSLLPQSMGTRFYRGTLWGQRKNDSLNFKLIDY